ncbi:helix-turn-helix domain-containing protein [Rhodococcus sp. HM1]|uniref:helix-turn-helix transcriptional regulator n=1 Tax=Rhodococcus sp. HM1 TaxID=2937759 RepID=UPI00200AA2AB|nr:helix-turn-helix domain-containing protein [Rhodococcus sp. HM1]MCK8674292.1 helix-turn-helix domain-containing protein [Rhodococcus sp. HM1]
MKVKSPEQVQRWRKRRGLTQDQLAYLTDCTQQTISLIETGKMSTLSEDLALAIARHVDCPWEDLFVAHESTVVAIVTNDMQSDSRRISA